MSRFYLNILFHETFVNKWSDIIPRSINSFSPKNLLFDDDARRLMTWEKVSPSFFKTWESIFKL